MIIHNPVITGSLQVNGTSVSSIDQVDNISGSVVTLTDASASLAAGKLNNTTDTLTGDLTVTGKITAQEFHTEFVSASIVYQSGSTQFGNSADDTHVFTGNVGIGTDTASAKLHVEIGSASEVDVARFRTINGADNHFLDISVDNTNNLVAYDSSGATAGAHVFRRGGTEAFRIDSSGRVGIGVEPSAWTFNVLQIKNSSVWTTGNDLGLSANSYYDGSNYRYIGSAATSRIYHNTDGSINFSNAPTGTAGNIVTFTERMKVNADGSVSFNQGSTSIPVGGISHYTNNYLYIKGGTAGGALGNDNFSSAFYALDNGDANIIAGSSNALVVKASGNVGIGTTDPQAVLHLHGNTQAWTTSPTIVMSSSNTGNANVRNWRIGPADTNFGNFHIGVSDTQGGIVDSDAEASTFTIDYTGKVGIGTISPEQKLHIEGRGIFDSGTSSDIIQFRNDNGGFVIGNTTNLASIDLSSTSNLRIRQGSTIPFYLNANGNLGIGVTSPDKKLEVKISDNTDGVYFAQTIGGSRASAGYSVGIGIDPEGYGNRNKVGIVVQGHPSGWSAGKMHFLNRLDIGVNGEADLSHSRMTIDYTGYIGIGSQTPQAALDVRGGAVTRVRINSNSGTNAGVLLAENGTDYWSFASTSGGNLQFFREGGGGNKMMLTSDGNLGINTSSPSYKLDVEGAVAFTDEILARSGTTSISNAGYVWENKFTGNGSFIHLKTNLGWGGSTQMYSLHFFGYAYGEAKPIDAQIGFYNYPPSGAPINVGNSGTHTIVLYQSSDGYIVIRIQFANSYFTGLTMSARNTAQGVTWPTITASAQNGTSNHF